MLATLALIPTRFSRPPSKYVLLIMLSKYKCFLFCLLLVCIVRTSKAVKSIEIQLIRIEDIPTEEFKQASEVQNIQVATAGPGLVGLYVPLFMVLPRYFSCPSKVDKDCFARI